MKPTCIAIAGIPTSGKTTMGNALSKASGIHFVDSNFGPGACAPPPDPASFQTDEGRIREKTRMRILKVLWCQYDISDDQEVARRLTKRAADEKAVPISLSYLREQEGRTEGIQIPHIVVRMEGGDEGTRAAVEAAMKYINEE